MPLRTLLSPSCPDYSWITMPDTVAQDALRARLSRLRAVVVLAGLAALSRLHRVMPMRDRMGEGADFRLEYAARVGSSQQIQAFSWRGHPALSTLSCLSSQSSLPGCVAQSSSFLGYYSNSGRGNTPGALEGGSSRPMHPAHKSSVFKEKILKPGAFREPGSPWMSSVKEAVLDSRPSNATRAILTNLCRRREQAIPSQSCHHLTACLVLSRRQVFRSRAPAFLNSQDIIAYSLNCPADDTSANCLQRAFVMRMTFAHALFHLVCNHPCRPSLARGVRFWYLVVGDIPSNMHPNYMP
jgi:hypothetical protein